MGNGREQEWGWASATSGGRSGSRYQLLAVAAIGSSNSISNWEPVREPKQESGPGLAATAVGSSGQAGGKKKSNSPVVRRGREADDEVKFGQLVGTCACARA